MQLIKANEATEGRRKMVFPLVVDAADGITTETGEAGGQPQVSYDGGANWANTTGVLTGGTNGSYQVQLTADEVNQSVGTNILGRYKSIRTAEARAIPIQIVAFDPHAVTDLGLSNLDAAISTRGTADTGDQMDLINAPNATAITAIQSGLSTLTAQQVWEYGTRTISSFGSLVSDIATAVWAAAVRTITGGTISTVSDKTDYSLTSAYDAAKAAAPAGAQMDLVNAPNATAIAAIQSGIATSAEIAALNDLSSAEAQSAAAAALAAYDPPTKAEMDAGLAGIDPPTTSEITTAVWAAATRSLTDKADFTLTAAYDAAKAAASATDVATVDTVVNAIKAKTDNLPASPAAVGSAMTLTSGERTAIADAVLDEEIDSAGATDDTLRAAAKAAWAQGFGKWTLVDTTLSLYGPDGASVVREFTVDDADSPTQRLPA